MAKQPCVYILASNRHGTIYIGVTGDLLQRLHHHRSGASSGFTQEYRVFRLVRYEIFEDMLSAIAREKQLKNWRRDWKINLIERDNRDWHDLATDFGFAPISRTLRPMDPETSSG
ncbi:GIY-YIG nuclease family protein [Chakrabartia godavariana]|nr:GIY-YIG nuclease family protein [Chakrabartia godavariana]